MVIEGYTVEHFDESEVREIEIDDKNYPELLRKIKKPPKALRIRGNLPPNRKIIAICGNTCLNFTNFWSKLTMALQSIAITKEGKL